MKLADYDRVGQLRRELEEVRGTLNGAREARGFRIVAFIPGARAGAEKTLLESAKHGKYGELFREIGGFVVLKLLQRDREIVGELSALGVTADPPPPMLGNDEFKSENSEPS